MARPSRRKTRLEEHQKGMSASGDNSSQPEEPEPPTGRPTRVSKTAALQNPGECPNIQYIHSTDRQCFASMEAAHARDTQEPSVKRHVRLSSEKCRIVYKGTQQ